MTTIKGNMIFSVGVCAFNEEKSVGRLLKGILNQRLKKDHVMREIVVVASGCTDGTEEEILKWQKKDGRIRLISERERKGKASAVNLLLKTTKSKILVLSSADLLPDKNCISYLIDGLRGKKIGMAAPRIIPLNENKELIGFAVNLQWELHHKINLQFPERPKAGELIAFKKIFNCIPMDSAVDEASIEPLIHLQGYAIKYYPEAIVYNKGPESIYDFLRQRRRIYAGHTELRRKYGYNVVTYSNFRILGALLSNIQLNGNFLYKTFLTILLESLGRLVGFLDYTLKLRSHTVWKIAGSTKNLVNKKS